MSRMIVASALLVLTGCLVAPAEESSHAAVAATCGGVPHGGSRCSHAATIPDGDPGGALLGPLSIADDGRVIEDVVLEMEISHTYSGDLRAWLYYDADGDGAYEAETPIELYLARPGRLDSPPMWAYPVALEGRYFFRREADAEALDGWDAGEFASFRGLDAGGSFFLRVVDAGDGGVGAIRSWTVHVKQSPDGDGARPAAIRAGDHGRGHADEESPTVCLGVD